MKSLSPILFVPAAMLAWTACSESGSTFDPPAFGDDVVLKVIGTVVAESNQQPIADASVWIDLETEEGSDPRATARTDAEGRFSMVFTESNCSVAVERAFRAFARKKGYSDGELNRQANGGVPILLCVAREQTIGFQLSGQ
jgi:hypothetical protein